MRRPSTSSVFPLFVLGIGALGACSASVGTSEADADTETTHTLLVVEQSAPIEDTAAARSHASVWFLRVGSEEHLAAATRLVTDELELPALGTCAALSPLGPSQIPETLEPVELAFAGDVRIETGREGLPLVVRTFPDVADLVSGVMYTLRDQDGLEFPVDGLLRIKATGSAEHDAMEAQVLPPRAPGGLAIDGMALSSVDMLVQRGAPLTLTWHAGSAEDLVYVDIEPVPGGMKDRIRCALADTGSGEIPPMAIPESTDMSIAVHRVRDVALRADTGQMGMAHFDLSVTTRVRVAGP